MAAKGERIEKLEAYVKQLVPPPHTYCSPYRTPYCSHRSGLCDLRDVRREVELPSEGYAAPPRPAARAADAPRPAPCLPPSNRDGILRGAAQIKKGQKKGRLVYEVY